MPGETSIKFVRIFYSMIKLIELILQIVCAYCLRSLRNVLSEDKKLIGFIGSIFNYIAIGGIITGSCFILTKNIWPRIMLKARGTEYITFGINAIFIAMNLLLGLFMKIKEEEKNQKSKSNYNILILFLCAVSFCFEFVCLICEERQIYLLKKYLNSIQVPPVIYDPQAIEDEIANANDMPPSYEETFPENVEPPPPYRWVVCENVGVGFARCAITATGCFVRNSDLPFIQSNEMNTTHESNLPLADTIQENQSFEAEPPLQTSSPDVDFASSSIEFVPATTSNEDQSQETSLSEVPSEAISGKNKASKDISKENTSEETSLSQEKTSNKKSVGKSDRKTAKSREDERPETDLTKPEEDGRDDSSFETLSSDQ